MNIYQHRFVAQCPVNGQAIIYDLEIRTTTKVLVEHLLTACALFRVGYHEDIADSLFARFGGLQAMRAHHHGVTIISLRGAR